MTSNNIPTADTCPNCGNKLVTTIGGKVLKCLYCSNRYTLTLVEASGGAETHTHEGTIDCDMESVLLDNKRIEDFFDFCPRGGHVKVTIDLIKEHK